MSETTEHPTTLDQQLESSILANVRNSTGLKDIEYINRFILQVSRSKFLITTSDGNVSELGIKLRSNKEQSKNFSDLVYNITLDQSEIPSWYTEENFPSTDRKIEFRKVHILEMEYNNERTYPLNLSAKPQGEIVFPVGNNSSINFKLNKEGIDIEFSQQDS